MPCQTGAGVSGWAGAWEASVPSFHVSCLDWSSVLGLCLASGDPSPIPHPRQTIPFCDPLVHPVPSPDQHLLTAEFPGLSDTLQK